MGKLKLLDKHIDVLAMASKEKTRLITLEGTVRSSKTVVAIQAFFYRVYDSNSLLHLIAGRDYDTINNNILSSEIGLLKQFSRYTKLRKDEIGGYYVELISPKGNKRIQLVGYNDKARWTKILGSSIEVIFVDEVNIANKQFIDECFSRQVSFDNPLTIWTLNGDTPTHYIYSDYINRCKIIGEAPVSIRIDMDAVEKAPQWYYMHFNMLDNPVMTREKIIAAESIYPVGSYYHTIKILGERGVPGQLIYLDYIDESKLIKDIEISMFHEFGIGVDIGGTRAQNSFVLVGFNYTFTLASVIDVESFQQVGYLEKTRRLIAFVEKCLAKGIQISYIAVDSAESNYIADLRSEFIRRNLPNIIGSDKATIKQRIDLVILMMARGKLQFNATASGRHALQAYKQSRWADGKIGMEREDKNEWINDIMDATEYALTRHMSRLLRT